MAKHTHGQHEHPYDFERNRMCPACVETGERLDEAMKSYSVATGFFGYDGRMWVYDGKDGTEVTDHVPPKH